MKNNVTRQDEIKYLYNKIVDNHIFNNQLTVNDLLNHISNGDLMLEMLDDDGSEVLDDSHIDSIKEVLPLLNKIADKPRSFIKTYEEKVPVETAKSINHKAIMKLSQDCNDWYARTITSVKPKNIISDLNEETIDLYENRFVCLLVKKISKILSDTKKYYLKQLQLLEDNKTVALMNKEFDHTTKSLNFYSKITKNILNNDDDSYKNKLVECNEKLSKMEKSINKFKKSVLFTQLHNKRISNTIQKTNILLFEHNYKKCYELWNILKEVVNENKLDIHQEVTDEIANNSYHIYNLILIICSLHDMDFEETTANKITLSEDGELSFKELVFVRGNEKLTITNEDTILTVSFTNNLNKHYKNKIKLFSNYKNFENITRSQFVDFSTHTLNDLIVTEKNSEISSQYALFSVNMTDVLNTFSLSERILRRFYGMGSNYAKEDLDNYNWGSYKTGLLIVSPNALRTNFIRIEKILNYHSSKNYNSTALTCCPLCNSNKISKVNTSDIQCNECNHIISNTYCNSCDPKHENKILWIKYKNEKFLQNKELVSNMNSLEYYQKLDKIELIMGEKAVTTFDLEKEESGWKLKTVCPNCGLTLGKNN